MNHKQELIYLDNNATTRIDPRVLDTMMPFLTDNFANAASTHHFGVGAHEAVKNARKQVADLLGADAHEIIFTSGATEAINLAIKGVAENYQDKGKHIITVQTEHSAVLDTCHSLEQKGFEVTYLPVKNDGLIELDELQKALRPDTILVSVMFANNETGVIQPIKEIAELTHNAGAIFMSDGTQAAGKIPVSVRDYEIDLLCMSAHKIHGPKGAGALYVKQKGDRKVKLQALLHGGGHERGLRSGTLNVPGIVGLGKACAIARAEMRKDSEKIEKLRNYLEEELLKIEDTTVNGIRSSRLPNVSNICFRNADSDAIIIGLSSPESITPLIAVSNGSACTSTSNEPSHVLVAMGLNERDAYSSIRFSLSKFTTQREINIVLETTSIIVQELRAMS